MCLQQQQRRVHHTGVADVLEEECWGRSRRGSEKSHTGAEHIALSLRIFICSRRGLFSCRDFFKKRPQPPPGLADSGSGVGGPMGLSHAYKSVMFPTKVGFEVGLQLPGEAVALEV